MTAVILIASALLVASPAAIDSLSASGHSAVRSFSSELVAPGGEITVTISAHDYGPFAQVVETLPEGFLFLGASLSDAAVRATGTTVKFTLLGEEQFTYAVAAPAVEGQHDFSGVLLDSHKNEKAIGGNINLRVGAETMPTQEPTPTLTPALTPAATPDRTPTPEPTFTPESTAIPQPTATLEPTSTPELTPAPEPTETPTPTSMPPPATSIPVPTATLVPTPKPTAILEPEATQTPTPEPTATSVPAAIPTDEGDGPSIPLWLVIMLAVAGPAIVIGTAYVVFQREQRRWPWSLFPMRRREPTSSPDPDEEP